MTAAHGVARRVRALDIRADRVCVCDSVMPCSQAVRRDMPCSQAVRRNSLCVPGRQRGNAYVWCYALCIKAAHEDGQTHKAVYMLVRCDAPDTQADETVSVCDYH